MADTLAQLYEKYNILNDAGDAVGQHEGDYLFILSAVKGSANDKRLASQFIAKFFKHFPQHADQSIDALIDLCEDEDVAIRKQAIRDLPTICKDAKEHVLKITDLLAQLLVGEDASELQIVNASLLTLMKLHPTSFLQGMFSQIVDVGDDVTREKAIKFLSAKLKTLSEDLMTKEVEETLLQSCRKAMQDCTKDEFLAFMSMLSGLKISKLVSGQQVLAEIITEQAELDKPFDANDTENTDKLLMCIKSALPYFSPYVTSNAYVQYLSLYVLPVLDHVNAAAGAEAHGIDLEVLQLLAELTPSVQPLNATHAIDIVACQQVIFSQLLRYVPLPPAELESAGDVTEPSLQLTHIESLMFAFHQLGKHNADVLSDEARLKDFRLRLQYLARGVQNYSKKLKDSLSGVKKAALQAEENQIKQLALKTTNNIGTLVRDFFHIPPSFKSTVVLSWTKPAVKGAAKLGVGVSPPAAKAAAAPAAQATGDSASKRKAIEFPEASPTKAAKTKNERQVYAPPSGKFSGNGRGSYTPGRGGFARGRGRGRGTRFAKRYSN